MRDDPYAKCDRCGHQFGRHNRHCFASDVACAVPMGTINDRPVTCTCDGYFPAEVKA